jgi:NADH-quinone oxidoreductase subunit C
MKQLIERLTSHFAISEVLETRPDQVFVMVPKDQAIAMVTHLRDFEGFSFFILLTAVDRIEDNKFQLTYILNHPEKKLDVGVRTLIDRDKPVMTTAHHLWESIATHQRELKEMYGIDFPGSPRVDVPFLLEGWDNIPPMRRDFDTKKYAEETYFPREGRKTNDPAQHMKKKLYPDE